MIYKVSFLDEGITENILDQIAKAKGFYLLDGSTDVSYVLEDAIFRGINDLARETNVSQKYYINVIPLVSGPPIDANANKIATDFLSNLYPFNNDTDDK